MKKIIRVLSFIIFCSQLGYFSSLIFAQADSKQAGDSFDKQASDSFGMLAKQAKQQLQPRLNKLLKEAKKTGRTFPVHNDIRWQTNDILRDYVSYINQILGNLEQTEDQSKINIIRQLLKNLHKHLDILANNQTARGISLQRQKEVFTQLLEAGLNVQLFLIHDLQEAYQGQTSMSRSVRLFKQAAGSLINSALILLAHQYYHSYLDIQKDIAAQSEEKKDDDESKDFANAQLMLARILLYPITTFDREPNKTYGSSRASSLEEKIASQQDKNARDFFAQLNIKIGKKYRTVLKKIFNLAKNKGD